MSEQKESVRDSDLEEGELSSDEEEEPLTVSDAASIYNVATSVYEQITMSESSDKEVEIDRIIEEAQQCLIAGNNPLLESNQHGAVSSTSVLSTMSTIPSLSIVSVWSQEGSDIAETNKEATTVAEVETSVDRDPLVSVNALEVGPSAQSAPLADSGDADDMDALRMAALQSLRISRAREDGEVSDDNGDSGGRTSASRSRCDSAVADKQKQSTSSVVPVTKKSASKDTLDVEPRRELSNRKRRVSSTSGRRRTSPSSSTSLGRDPSEDRSKRSRRNEGTGRERRHHDRESSPIGVGHKSSRRRYRQSRSPAASYKPASPSRVSSSKSKSKPLKRDSVLSKLSSSVVVTRTITNDAALANAVREPSIGSIVDEDDAGALERGPSQRTIASGNTSQALLVTVSRETAPAPVTSAGGMSVTTAAITTDAHATNPASVSDGRRRHRSHVDMVLGEDTMDTVPAEPVSKKAAPPSADTIKITRLMALTPPPPPPLPPLPAAQSAAVFIPQSPPPPPPPLDPTEDDVKPDMNTEVQPSHHVQRTVSNIPIAAGVPVTHADNYEDVGMDIASSSDTTSRDCTRPPTRQRIVSETDETALRNLLLMQLQERRQTVPDNVSSSGRPATADSLALSNEDRGASSSALPPRKRRSIESTGSRSPMMGETPGSYKKKLREVARLDRQMQTRFHQMEQMTAEREKLMRRVGELTNQLGEYREEYWQKSEERDRLRRDARRYERQRMRTMLDNSHLVHLNSAIEREQERARELSDRYEQMECDSASEDEEEDDQGEEENAEETRDRDNMDQEMAADCDIQHESMEVSMNEDELRRMLLERMNAKQSADGEGRERDSVPVEETQTEPDQNTSLDVVAREQGLTIENAAPMALAEHSEEVVARECDGSRDADAYTPPLSGDDEVEMRPRERQFTGLVGGVPRRLLRHMQCSSETESRLDPLLEICPFELMGTCKDYSCEYQHTRDHELPLRDVMLMVLQYAPQLAGEHLQYSSLRDQLDSVLGSRLSGESNQAFVGRILGRLDGVERRELIDNSVQDETGDFDNYYSTLQIGAR